MFKKLDKIWPVSSAVKAKFLEKNFPFKKKKKKTIFKKRIYIFLFGNYTHIYALSTYTYKQFKSMTIKLNKEDFHTTISKSNIHIVE